MSEGHTAGPWTLVHIEPRQTGDPHYLPGQWWIYAPAEPLERRRHIAHVWANEADAALISSAPDLLEAAEEYMRTVHMGHTQFVKTGEDFNPLCAMFRAAIAKAEGRTP